VKYELGFYITGVDILHSQRRENLKSYNLLFISFSGIQPGVRLATGWESRGNAVGTASGYGTDDRGPGFDSHRYQIF
jgi:hypothetical protein